MSLFLLLPRGRARASEGAVGRPLGRHIVPKGDGSQTPCNATFRLVVLVDQPNVWPRPPGMVAFTWSEMELKAGPRHSSTTNRLFRLTFLFLPS